MHEPNLHSREPERLKELESFSILDSLPEDDYDQLTAIASEICGTEISLISLLDDKRQWFKSHHGLEARETPKKYAFCAHAILDPENVLIVNDSRKDLRFHDNPLVTDDPLVIFYAGVPLISDNGLPLGTLCVIDHEPKSLSENQIKSLQSLANQVMNLLNLRRTKLALEKSNHYLEEKNIELERFAAVAAHDLKSPLMGINSIIEIISENYSEGMDRQLKEMFGLISKASNQLTELIGGLLEYSKCQSVLKAKRTNICLHEFVGNIKGLHSYEKNLNLKLTGSIFQISVNKMALEQVFINLITNSIKYNDKERVEIEIGVSDSPTHYQFFIQDNGPGIAPEYHQSIFEIFKVLNNKDKFGTKGNGIGLASVKKVIENCGGCIKVESELSHGARFVFTMEK